MKTELFTAENIALWSGLGPKKSLYYAAEYLRAALPQSVFLTADLANRFGLAAYREKYPDRFFDAGICEGAMVGMAAGMAAEGKIPLCFGYAPFMSARVLDQIRVNIGIMGLPVILIGADAGLTSNELGPALTALEDIANIRSVPGLTLICPGDCTEMIQAVIAAAQEGKPAYIRVCGGPGCPVLHDAQYRYAPGRGGILSQGADLTILSNGPLLREALSAGKELRARGISCGVVNLHTVKPLDTLCLDAISTPRVAVAEEHSVIGGLGSAVAEYFSQRPHPPRLKLLGTPDGYAPADTRVQGLKRFGLDGASLSRRLEAFCKE